MAEETHIAVNLLWCVPGKVGGSEQYLVRQLRGLARDESDRPPVRLYALADFASAHPDLADSFEFVTSSIAGNVRVQRIAVEHAWLRARTRGAAIVHHGGGTMPIGTRRPTVLTIHDLQYLTSPEYHSPLKLRYLRSVVPRSIRRADLIATPTEWVRQTVIDASGVEPARAVVVPHGFDSTPSRMPDLRAVRERYGLGTCRWIVFPAVTHPHKGHRFLLDVMAAAWTAPDLRLVLIGGTGRAEHEIAHAVRSYGLADRVLRPGRVPAADRDALIAGAEALVFPSEYEGFGAPVIEAMALGTPVIASDHPAVVEVVADAGLVLPRDVEAWKGALDEVTDRRIELVDRGHRRSAEFSIERSGAALASAYARVLA